MPHINDFLSTIDHKPMLDFCLANGSTVSYAKGDSMVEAGDTCRYFGIVKSGYFKYCTLKENGEFAVTGFAFPNDCVTDFTRSFLLHKPSRITIIAGSDAEVCQISLSVVRDYVLAHHPDLLAHASAILLDEAYRRYLNLYSTSPTERYLELTKSYPELLETVALRDIASYLLVTPVYLSRIRKKLALEAKE